MGIETVVGAVMLPRPRRVKPPALHARRCFVLEPMVLPPTRNLNAMSLGRLVAHHDSHQPPLIDEPVNGSELSEELDPAHDSSIFDVLATPVGAAPVHIICAVLSILINGVMLNGSAELQMPEHISSAVLKLLHAGLPPIPSPVPTAVPYEPHFGIPNCVIVAVVKLLNEGLITPGTNVQHDEHFSGVEQHVNSSLLHLCTSSLLHASAVSAPTDEVFSVGDLILNAIKCAHVPIVLWMIVVIGCGQVAEERGAYDIVMWAWGVFVRLSYWWKQPKPFTHLWFLNQFHICRNFYRNLGGELASSLPHPVRLFLDRLGSKRAAYWITSILLFVTVAPPIYLIAVMYEILKALFGRAVWSIKGLF